MIGSREIGERTEMAMTLAGTTLDGLASSNMSSPNIASSNIAPALSRGAAPAFGQGSLKTVSVCDTQPVTVEGVRTLLNGCGDLECSQAAHSLAEATEVLKTHGPAVLLVDKAFGIQPILEWLTDLRSTGTELLTNTAVVVWGPSVTEAEALRFMQAGARGILRKTANIPVVLACLRTVAAGRSWMEDCVFGDNTRSERYPSSELTSREQQVLELVEQGFKNREIALELGIRPGTVKIHLKHIFEKTGVRGRYGLALNGLKDRGMMTVPA